MAGGLFKRLKIWAFEEVLASKDLNAEFDNIINNLMPSEFSSIAQTITQMQIQIDPGLLGTENLAINNEQDIEQLRFAIARLSGTTYWYQAPALNIAEINSLLKLGVGIQSNRVVSGRIDIYDQPQFLLAAGSSLQVTLKAGGGNPIFSYVVNNAAVTTSADIPLPGLSPAPSSNNMATVNNAAIVNDFYAGQDNADINQIVMSGAGSAITSQIGSYAAFKVVDGPNTEYFLAFVQDSTTLTHVLRGYYFDSASLPIQRIGINNADTLTIMRLTWVFALNTGTSLDVVYTNPTVSTIAPVTPATGDYWFDLINQIWKKFNGTAFVDSKATLIGTCIQDTANCVGSRSGDFFAIYNDLNTVTLKKNSNSGAIGLSNRSQISVAGNIISYAPYALQWNAPANLDTAVTITASKKYYFYITDKGATIISDQFPYDRKADLLGLYHPYKPWRCVGETITDGASHFVICGDYTSNYQIIATMVGTPAIANGTQTVIPFDTATFDPDNLISNLGTNTFFMTIPRKGIYSISASASMAAANITLANVFGTRIPVVGAVVGFGQDNQETPPAATVNCTFARHCKFECGDKLDIGATQFSAGAGTFVNTEETWFTLSVLPAVR